MVSVFSASANCAFADSSWPWRSMSFASRSAVSTRASTLPGLHGVAFAHGDIAHVARDLRLDRGLADRLHGAGHRQPARQRLVSATASRPARIRASPARSCRFRGLPAASWTTRIPMAARSATARSDDDRDGDAPPGEAYSHEFSLSLLAASRVGPAARFRRRPCLDAARVRFGFCRDRYCRRRTHVRATVLRRSAADGDELTTPTPCPRRQVRAARRPRPGNGRRICTSSRGRH